MKYLKEVRERFGKAAAFTISDLSIILKPRGISKAYLHLLVHNLLAKGEIRKITRGIYTFRDDAEVVGFGFRPFYYGLQEALSLRGLWEQESNPVVITPRKVRAGSRVFAGANFVVRRISRSMFFGFDMLRYNDFWIPVSDVEKTLIDLVYFDEPLDKETLKEIKSRLDKKILDGYLKRCPQWHRKQVLKLIAKNKERARRSSR